MQRILILGMGKSGTTVMYYRILEALGPEAIGLFEPIDYRPDIVSENNTRDCVAKVLTNHNPNLNSFSPFEKKFLLSRDPRDQIVSSILYSAFRRASLNVKRTLLDPANLMDLVCKLKAKESSPHSISLLDVFDVDPQLHIRQWREFQFILERYVEVNRLFICRYEDFVEHRVEGLESFLGFPLPVEVEVAAKHDRVVRSKTSGHWRHYFTKHDIDAFRPALEPVIQKLGYDLDWDLAPNPSINPDECSRYVQRIVRDKIMRAMRQHGELADSNTELRRRLAAREVAPSSPEIAEGSSSVTISLGQRIKQAIRASLRKSA